jgi:hypothetical protein
MLMTDTQAMSITTGQPFCNWYERMWDVKEVFVGHLSDINSAQKHFGPETPISALCIDGRWILC